MIKIPSKSYYKEHLKKYSQYTNSSDWISWGLHIIPYRAKRTAKILGEYVEEDARVLDLGCGIGLSLHIVAQYFANITGCDIDKKALIACSKILKKVGIRNTNLKIYNGHRLPFKSNSFDAVLSIEVIEHAEKPDIMLREIQRVLKKNGVLVITTPNKYWPLETHYKLFFLTYLPQKFADLYVKISHKGVKYDIYPLSYNQFSSLVNKYFDFKDVTLDIISRYKDFKLNYERGEKVKYAALLIRILQELRIDLVKKIVTYFSAGWIFIAKPK